ncbi:hypothetical protein [Paenibacillus sp. URB8-2]|uniref:hypothetical protein n=1 Tax=Paenibacillus sp. URB8-2 TaxID=2741301 RepID=UPI001E53B003|nr:hypothetical protein [Paenibacillus sp. URB8-2]
MTPEAARANAAAVQPEQAAAVPARTPSHLPGGGEYGSRLAPRARTIGLTSRLVFRP